MERIGTRLKPATIIKVPLYSNVACDNILLYDRYTHLL